MQDMKRYFIILYSCQLDDEMVNGYYKYSHEYYPTRSHLVDSIKWVNNLFGVIRIDDIIEMSESDHGRYPNLNMLNVFLEERIQIDENQIKRAEDEKVQTKTSVEMLYDLKGVEVPNLIEPMSSDLVDSILDKINNSKPTP